MHRAHVPYQSRNLSACVVDPSCDDDEWRATHAQQLNRSPQYNQNRNLVRAVAVGSIALIPRPSLGLIFCGRVVHDFELVNSPPWYDHYMQLRHDQGRKEEDSDKWWHAADVAQSWEVDEFRPIPVPRIPAWIRRSLFGRSTYGVIHSQEGIDEDPHATMVAILGSSGFRRRDLTLDLRVVERRLMEDLTPSTFEHLVVSLLQLEHANETWVQVGGSGDGGVDGVGADQQGNVAGLLQCKWQYWGGEPFVETVWKVDHRIPYRTYLASLLYPKGVVLPTNSVFLDRSAIARLVSNRFQPRPPFRLQG
jgi:hypothetical protein